MTISFLHAEALQLHTPGKKGGGFKESMSRLFESFDLTSKFSPKKDQRNLAKTFLLKWTTTSEVK